MLLLLLFPLSHLLFSVCLSAAYVLCACFSLCSSAPVTHPFFLCSNTDVHTVASLLKLYLRELPEPVVPFHKYEEFLSCAKLLSKDDEMVRKSA